MKQPINAS